MRSKAISSGIWFTISNFIVRSIGLITTPIFTRLLTKSEFGDFNNFATWTGILLVIVSLNLEASLIRARFDFEKDLDNYVFSMIALSTFSTCLWYAIALIFRGYLTSFLSMDFKYVTCMFLYLLTYPAINIFQTAERFQYKYKLTVALSMAVSISTSLLSVLLVYWFPDRLMGRTIGYVLPVFLIGIGLVIYCFQHRCKIKTSYWKYALPFTLPYIPHLLSMNLLSGLDRIMIKKYCGAEDLAIYSLAYTCGSLITILVSSINSAYSPWLGEKLAKKDYKEIRKLSIPYVASFWYMAGGTILIIPELLFLMGGSAYMEAKYVMPPVAASCILQFIYCMYVNVEQFEKKTNAMALASVFSVVINYVSNYIFIIRFGYIAAAYTTYASYFVLMLFHMLIVKKIGLSKVYHNKIIIMLAIGSLLLVSISNMLVENSIARYIVLLMYILAGVIVIYKNKEVAKRIINRRK